MLYNLHALREDNDITQETIAKLLNVRQATYSNYELGKTSIPISSLKVLADFFNTSIDFLVDYTDNPKPYPKRKRPLPED